MAFRRIEASELDRLVASAVRVTKLIHAFAMLSALCSAGFVACVLLLIGTPAGIAALAGVVALIVFVAVWHLCLRAYARVRSLMSQRAYEEASRLAPPGA